MDLSDIVSYVSNSKTIKDIVTLAENNYFTLKDRVSEHYIEITLIGMDTLAAGMLIGKAYYGFNHISENPFLRFFLTDTFPHIILGAAPIATAFYFLEKYSPAKIRNLVLSTIPASALFIREYLQNAPDSISDSLWSGAGLFLGVTSCKVIHSYLNDKAIKRVEQGTYHQNQEGG